MRQASMKSEPGVRMTLGNAAAAGVWKMVLPRSPDLFDRQRARRQRTKQLRFRPGKVEPGDPVRAV